MSGGLSGFAARSKNRMLKCWADRGHAWMIRLQRKYITISSFCAGQTRSSREVCATCPACRLRSPRRRRRAWRRRSREQAPGRSPPAEGGASLAPSPGSLSLFCQGEASGWATVRPPHVRSPGSADGELLGLRVQVAQYDDHAPPSWVGTSGGGSDQATVTGLAGSVKSVTQVPAW